MSRGEKSLVAFTGSANQSHIRFSEGYLDAFKRIKEPLSEVPINPPKVKPSSDGPEFFLVIQRGKDQRRYNVTKTLRALCYRVAVHVIEQIDFKPGTPVAKKRLTERAEGFRDYCAGWHHKDRLERSIGYAFGTRYSFTNDPVLLREKALIVIANKCTGSNAFEQVEGLREYAVLAERNEVDPAVMVDGFKAILTDQTASDQKADLML